MDSGKHDLIEGILSLLEFLREKGVPVDRSTEPSVLGLLPEEAVAGPAAPALRAAYETLCFMDKIPGGFMIYRAGGEERIVYANRGLLRMFRCGTWIQFQEATGGSFRGLVHPEDLDGVERSIQRQIAESQLDLDYVEYRITRRDGTTAWIEDYGHFVHGNTVGDYFYVFLADATEKRERRLEEELQKEQQQKRMLEEALENADLAVVAKNEFLTNMSHNMRTPMNAIFGFTALAKMKTEDPELLDYLERVDAASQQLMGLIEKALEVSWIGSKEQDTEEECDLSQVVWEVFDAFCPQAEEKGLEFTLECPGGKPSLVWANREKLKQLVTNLTSNAVTYTQPGGRVSLCLTEGDMVSVDRRTYRLSVEDTGIGISEEFLEKIFEPFARERDTTHSGVNGMGLGLTLVKYIVDRMGGSIQVDSTEGKGSVFTVTLQLKVPAGAPEEEKPAGKEQSAALRILLVEDNDINREIETEILRRGGFAVDEAENGQIAVDKMRNAGPDDYDLILMDIQMPVMDGCEAARLIRKLEDPKKANIPIVALSANTSMQDMRRSIESGMDAYLTKPIDVPHLLEEIRRAAGQRHSEKNS